MDAPLPKGTKVKQVVKVLEGTVTDVRFDADKLAFTYLVTGADTERWFDAADITVVPEGKAK